MRGSFALLDRCPVTQSETHARGRTRTSTWGEKVYFLQGLAAIGEPSRVVPTTQRRFHYAALVVRRRVPPLLLVPLDCNDAAASDAVGAWLELGRSAFVAVAGASALAAFPAASALALDELS